MRQDHVAAADRLPVASFEGEVWVNRQNLPQLSRGDLFDMRKQFGVLFQSGALFTDLDVFENVAFPLRVHTQLPEEMIRDIVLMKLQAVGLRGAVELMPDELSGGMKRRVALARAIALTRRSCSTTSRSWGRIRSPWASWCA